MNIIIFQQLTNKNKQQLEEKLSRAKNIMWLKKMFFRNTVNALGSMLSAKTNICVSYVNSVI